MYSCILRLRQSYHPPFPFLYEWKIAQMEELWKDQMNLEHVPDFEDCIRKAWQDSQTGDIVVLSPACASFDRFHNFEHRGDVFKSIVEKMANEV
jgi:UDP-N-acetylmuramoylalanine--D-glutamate ligase